MNREQIEQAAKERVAIEVNKGNDNDALFISRIGIQQIIERCFIAGAEMVNEDQRKTLINYHEFYLKWRMTVSESSAENCVNDFLKRRNQKMESKKPIEILAESILPNKPHAREIFINNQDVYSPNTTNVIEAMKIFGKQAFEAAREMRDYSDDHEFKYDNYNEYLNKLEESKNG